MVDEGVAAEMKQVTRRVTIWWPLRVAAWFFGGLSDIELGMGITSHPEKPICISMVDSRAPSRGFGIVMFNVATARVQAEHLLMLCDQIETFRGHTEGLPVPKLNPGEA